MDAFESQHEGTISGLKKAEKGFSISLEGVVRGKGL